MTTADIWSFAATRLPVGWSATIELPGHVRLRRAGVEVGVLSPTRGGDLDVVACREPDPLDDPATWFAAAPDPAQAFDDAVAWIDAAVPGAG